MVKVRTFLILMLLSACLIAEPVRLPRPRGDVQIWGALINQFLRVSHKENGTLKESALEGLLVDETDPCFVATGVETSDSVNVLADVDTITDSPATNEVLKWDGSNWVPTAYDYSFVFSIVSFTDNEAATQLIGTGVWEAAGITFGATYNEGPPDSASVALSSNGGVTWDSALTLDSPYTSGASAEDTNYPSSRGNYVRFTLTATKDGSPDTSAQTVTFQNHIYWGYHTDTTADEATVEGLSGGSSAISGDNTRTFTVTAGENQYIWFCYPKGIGTVTFSVGGFEGGFEDPETVSVTNTAGDNYTEDYYAYRSSNDNLGETEVVTE